MSQKEAQARIKINKLLEAAGWRFFDEVTGKANIALEPNVKLQQAQVDAMGNDFDTTRNGFIDFLLLDDHGFPLVVLEAKAESKNPLIGKEQARKYAKAQNCRFVILSNGNLHYLWDLSQGNPHIITAFPAPAAIKGYAQFKPDPTRLVGENVALDYIARTQMPAYDHEVGWKTEALREQFTQKNRLRFMRACQQRAMKADLLVGALLHVSESAVKESNTRLAQPGSLLILVRGIGLANGVSICEIAMPCAFNQDVNAMEPTTAVDATFLRLSRQQQTAQFEKILETAAHGTLKINTPDFLKIQFPLPSLDAQRAIVAEIEAEQALVNANRKLNRRMEARVKSAIDRVWATP